LPPVGPGNQREDGQGPVPPRSGRGHGSLCRSGAPARNHERPAQPAAGGGGRRVKAVVHVELKPGVLDPRGKAIAHALNGLGFKDVEGARVGKVITLDLAAKDKAAAEKEVAQMCEKLLANTVIERYRVEIEA